MLTGFVLHANIMAAFLDPGILGFLLSPIEMSSCHLHHSSMLPAQFVATVVAAELRLGEAQKDGWQHLLVARYFSIAYFTLATGVIGRFEDARHSGHFPSSLNMCTPLGVLRRAAVFNELAQP